MKVKVIQETSWNRALNAARRTIGKTPIDREPSDNWKKMVIMAEHSPIKKRNDRYFISRRFH